jgi:monoterpene epsilon-lactone hydrolase
MSDAMTPLPIPTSVSEQAQQFLGQALRRTEPMPALADTEGWSRVADEGNEYILERFAGLELPVSVDETSIAGVPTFVIHAHDVSAGEETPIYLDIHGGGLTIGNGEACRLMTSAGALSSGMLHWAVDYRMPPTTPTRRRWTIAWPSMSSSSRNDHRRTSSSAALRQAETWRRRSWSGQRTRDCRCRRPWYC